MDPVNLAVGLMDSLAAGFRRLVGNSETKPQSSLSPLARPQVSESAAHTPIHPSFPMSAEDLSSRLDTLRDALSQGPAKALAALLAIIPNELNTMVDSNTTYLADGLLRDSVFDQVLTILETHPNGLSTLESTPLFSSALRGTIATYDSPLTYFYNYAKNKYDTQKDKLVASFEDASKTLGDLSHQTPKTLPAPPRDTTLPALFAYNTLLQQTIVDLTAATHDLQIAHEEAKERQKIFHALQRDALLIDALAGRTGIAQDEIADFTAFTDQLRTQTANIEQKETAIRTTYEETRRSLGAALHEWREAMPRIVVQKDNDGNPILSSGNPVRQNRDSYLAEFRDSRPYIDGIATLPENPTPQDLESATERLKADINTIRTVTRMVRQFIKSEPLETEFDTSHAISKKTGDILRHHGTGLPEAPRESGNQERLDQRIRQQVFARSAPIVTHDDNEDMDPAPTTHIPEPESPRTRKQRADIEADRRAEEGAEQLQVNNRDAYARLDRTTQALEDFLIRSGYSETAAKIEVANLLDNLTKKHHAPTGKDLREHHAPTDPEDLRSVNHSLNAVITDLRDQIPKLAATKIQATFRMHQAKKDLHTQNAAATVIQRMERGRQDRAKVEEMRRRTAAPQDDDIAAQQPRHMIHDHQTQMTSSAAAPFNDGGMSPQGSDDFLNAPLSAMSSPNASFSDLRARSSDQQEDRKEDDDFEHVPPQHNDLDAAVVYPAGGDNFENFPPAQHDALEGHQPRHLAHDQDSRTHRTFSAAAPFNDGGMSPQGSDDFLNVPLSAMSSPNASFDVDPSRLGLTHSTSFDHVARSHGVDAIHADRGAPNPVDRLRVIWRQMEHAFTVSHDSEKFYATLDNGNIYGESAQTVISREEGFDAENTTAFSIGARAASPSRAAAGSELDDWRTPDSYTHKLIAAFDAYRPHMDDAILAIGKRALKNVIDRDGPPPLCAYSVSAAIGTVLACIGDSSAVQAPPIIHTRTNTQHEAQFISLLKWMSTPTSANTVSMTITGRDQRVITAEEKQSFIMLMGHELMISDRQDKLTVQISALSHFNSTSTWSEFYQEFSNFMRSLNNPWFNVLNDQLNRYREAMHHAMRKG